ncbi:MAG: hypothetical protein GXO85_03635 [Chlorobi bacterium]|nr:hypothetical protein [Chlorobiota bacterium]
MLPINESEMLEIVLYNGLHHFQSKTEQNLFRKNKIKSVSFVKNILSTSEVDSLTFLEIDKNGRIKIKTTNECTTVGCLPYTIRQIYNFHNGEIVRMDDYVFKRKYSNKFGYWLEKDTSRLSKFDWEDYTYLKDTILVESASQKWTIVRNSSGKIISKKLTFNTGNQYSLVNYSYYKSKIIENSLSNFMEEPVRSEYSVTDFNIVTYLYDISNDVTRRKEYKFNAKGLLSNIYYFQNDSLKAETTINYSQY